jgi:hypothetical protein
MKETAEYFEKRFFLLTGLRFKSPYQNFMPHIEIMKFCLNLRSLQYTTLLSQYY